MPPLDFRENLIVDQNNPILIQKAWREHDRQGWAYLAAPYGEDALVWNVFRSLDRPEGTTRTYPQREIVQMFFGLQAPVQELLFWGCNPDGTGESQQQLSIALRTLDGKRKGTMTEPDLVVVTESEVCFVECKLLFTPTPWSARERKSPRTQLEEMLDSAAEGATAALAGWQKRWDVYTAEPITGQHLPQTPTADDAAVYQLIRNAIYAQRLAQKLGGKKAIVVSLVSHLQTELHPRTSDLYAHFQNRCAGFVEVREPVYWEALQLSVPTEIARYIDRALGLVEERVPRYVESVLSNLRSGDGCRRRLAQDVVRSLTPRRLQGHFGSLVKCLGVSIAADAHTLVMNRLANAGRDALPAIREGLIASNTHQRLNCIAVLERMGLDATEASPELHQICAAKNANAAAKQAARRLLDKLQNLSLQ
jgi:hypothetical protein